MAKVSEIFNKLVEDRKVVLRTNSKAAHDLLRVRLCKLFSNHKTLLDSVGASDDTSSLSVSGEYQDGEGISTFYIRKAKGFGREEKVEFEILDEEPNALAS